MQRQLKNLRNASDLSADDVNAINLFADAIQRRINLFRMTKVNFFRSRTGILFRVSAWSKLQKQLAQAQRALADERSNHEATEEFLQHQSKARADGEELIEQLRTEMEELKAQLAAKASGLGEDAQTEVAKQLLKTISGITHIQNHQLGLFLNLHITFSSFNRVTLEAESGYVLV